MRYISRFILFFYLFGSIPAVAQKETEKRRLFLDDILRINVKEDHRAKSISRRISNRDSTWMDWLSSGELPPDFDRMESIPFLPDPLQLKRDGKCVRIDNPADWNIKREEIKKNYKYWVSGEFPPAPESIRTRLLESHAEGDVRSETVEIVFGPENRARMTVELIIPAGDGPFPVYMTQWNHRSWAQLAVKRGYMACVYAGADDKDDTQAYQAIYPDYDFTCLMRRAWGASRAVDYLYTRSDVDTARIAITGHSRNGKQSLWAAAFDERIKAVVSSSCGTGGITPWRYSDPQYCNQTLDDIAANAAHWFHPRLRFFFGREDKLPTDQNLMISLIAPRPLLLHYSIVEGQLNPWANEQCYESVKSVYDMLGASDCVHLLPRMGEHPVATRDLERCLDFLDIQFHRNSMKWNVKERYFDFSFDQWAEAHKEDQKMSRSIRPVHIQPQKGIPAIEKQKAAAKENLLWLLGDEPGSAKPKQIEATDASRMDWIELITGRPAVKNAQKIFIAPYTSMGDHLSGVIYMPVEKKFSKTPVVIYLHQYAYAHGYAYGYNPDLGPRGNSVLFQHFIDKGFAVMTIDMFGFGTRIGEAENFYERFPQWSKMGKMVSDVRAVVDAVPSFDNLDPDKIFILGNTIGGTVGLMAAALDTRVAGVSVVASVSPWRRSNSRYESIRTLSHAHGLLPRLGWYADCPAEVPVDYAEIMASVSPRPLQVIAPVLDRYADPDDVKKTLGEVSGIYAKEKANENFDIMMPREINRITWSMLDDISSFFLKQINNKK